MSIIWRGRDWTPLWNFAGLVVFVATLVGVSVLFLWMMHGGIHTWVGKAFLAVFAAGGLIGLGALLWPRRVQEADSE